MRSEDILSLEKQMKLADAVAEEVAIEENAAYRLCAEDQLQAEQVTTDTSLAYGLRNEHKNPAERVAESAHPSNSDPPLLEYKSE